MAVSARQKVITLRTENPGMPGTEIAALVGISRQRVAQILETEGLPTKAELGKREVPYYMKPEHRCWRNLIDRCENPNSSVYQWYGARGIKVCARWRKSYDHFLADMGLRPSPKHSIDRIDNDGNYEPSNCRWATAAEQRANQRAKEVDRMPHALAITYLNRVEWPIKKAIREINKDRRYKTKWTFNFAYREKKEGRLPFADRKAGPKPKT